MWRLFTSLIRVLFLLIGKNEIWLEGFKEDVRIGIGDCECRYSICYKEKGRNKVLIGVGSGLRDGYFF